MLTLYKPTQYEKASKNCSPFFYMAIQQNIIFVALAGGFPLPSVKGANISPQDAKPSCFN